jgi:hypothetical protein
MKAISLSSYTKISEKTGKPYDMFVYGITKSTEDEMNAYKAFLADKGYELREQDGMPLFQSLSYGGENIEIKISPTTGIPYIDNSSVKKARSIARQYGAEEQFKQSIATSIANSLTADIFVSRPTAKAVLAEKNVTPVQDEVLDNQEDAL